MVLAVCYPAVRPCARGFVPLGSSFLVGRMKSWTEDLSSPFWLSLGKEQWNHLCISIVLEMKV